jgi:hypothetical protein
MNRTRRNTTAALAAFSLIGSFALSAVPAHADDVVATVVVADVVLTPAPVVDSQLSAAAVAEKGTVDPTASLASVKARAAEAIAKRQRDIAERQAKLASQTTDCGYNAARAAEMTATSGGLAALGTTIAASTDLAATKALNKTIYTDYRVYLVVFPKLGKVLRCDNQLKRIADLGTAGVKVQAAIDAAKAQGANTAGAQAQKDAALGLISGVNPKAAIDACMGLVPDRGDKALQANNAAALGACDGALDANAKTLKSAGERLHEAWKSLKGAKADDRAEDKIKRDAEKATREAERNAAKAVRDAEKATRQAERDTAKALREAQKEADKAAREALKALKKS